MANDEAAEPTAETKVGRVALDDVLSQRPVPSVREVPPLTKIGYKLAIFLLGYLSVVTAVLLTEYFINAPSFPKGSTLDAAQVTQYQQLSQIATDRTIKLLDTLVLKGFLPVLTAVLGYIFGTRGVDKEEA